MSANFKISLKTILYPNSCAHLGLFYARLNRGKKDGPGGKDAEKKREEKMEGVSTSWIIKVWMFWFSNLMRFTCLLQGVTISIDSFKENQIRCMLQSLPDYLSPLSNSPSSVFKEPQNYGYVIPDCDLSCFVQSVLCIHF